MSPFYFGTELGMKHVLTSVQDERAAVPGRELPEGGRHRKKVKPVITPGRYDNNSHVSAAKRAVHVLAVP